MPNKLLNQYFIFAGVHSLIPEESYEMIKNDLKPNQKFSERANEPRVGFREGLKDVVLCEQVLSDDLPLGLVLLQLDLEHLVNLLILVQHLVTHRKQKFYNYSGSRLM
jgi:hypothetical protein